MQHQLLLWYCTGPELALARARDRRYLVSPGASLLLRNLRCMQQPVSQLQCIDTRYHSSASEWVI